MKILYTATVLSHICQFHLLYLNELQKHGHVIHVAAHDNLAEKNGLKLNYTDHFVEIPFHRSPLTTDNILAYKQLKDLICQEKYDLIVCNTPVGGVLTRLASKSARKNGTKVIYIAHGFHFFKGASVKSWLMYYTVEKFLAAFCDMLITVNNEDYLLAANKFKTSVHHIHGIGVSAERYHSVNFSEFSAFRGKEGISENDYVILCTGELNKNKDQSTLIRAVSRVKNEIPNIKILLAGNGPLEDSLKDLVIALGLENIVHFLGYRTDLECVVPMVDVVVSCSHREGMPLNIIEAMLCQKPVVAAINRGTRELIEPESTGYLFTANDDIKLAEYLKCLLDPKIRNELGAKGYIRAQAYTVDAVKHELLNLIENS